MKIDIEIVNLLYKTNEMNTTQIRQRIHEYVDHADERLLSLISGMIDADLNQDGWGEIHPNLQAAIDRAKGQSDRSEGRSHEEVMDKLRAKYKK